MKRKILSLILVFAMTVSLFTVGASAAEPTYGDTAGHWAESSIERWSGHGIIQGSNGLFDPNGQLTCAQLATILAKLLKLPAAKDAGFTDNTADAWYYDAINRCAAAGILNGNGDGTVTPDAPISRERAMVMLARALGIEPIRKPDLTKYTDAAQVSAYAQGYVAALIEAGIVGGVTADELAPQDNITRAATVTILDRAISTYADKAGATVKADGKGLVLVVAENVKITGAPEGTKIVVADGATGLTVNGKAVSDDQTYIVPKTEPAKPSGGSSGGGYSHSHTWVYNYCNGCGQFKDTVVAAIGKKGYETLEAAINAAQSGDTVKLMKNIAISPELTDEQKQESKLAAQLTVNTDIVLDMNGKKLSVTEGDFGKASPLLIAVTGGTVTVKGNGEINCEAGESQVYGINVNGGNLIIEDGTFYGAITAVQVQQGSLIIKGGTFDLAPTCKSMVSQYAKYIVNVIDSAWKNGTATVSISGGTFGFDPSANPEGTGTTYLADGYQATETAEGSGFWTITAASDAVFVAEVGGVQYTTLAAAIAAAQDGATVKLVDNITTDEGIAVAKKVTLDMANHTITSAVKQVFTVLDAGDLTITGNGTITGPTGEAAKNFDSYSMIYVTGTNAKLTVMDGKITAGGVGDCGMYGIYVADGGNVILGDAGTKTGPTITTWFAAVGENNTTSPANITIYGGEYTAQAAPADSDWWAYFCAPVYASASGDINISGGTFNGYYGISSRYVKVAQNLNISGGTFNGSKSALFADNEEGSAKNGERTISITGGTFSSDPSKYVAEGYIARENNGKYVVSMVGTAENPYTLNEFNALTKLSAGRDKLYVDIGDVSLKDDSVTIGNTDIADVYTSVTGDYTVGQKLDDGRVVTSVWNESKKIYLANTNKLGTTLYIRGSVKDNNDYGLNNEGNGPFPNSLNFVIPDASKVVFTKDFTVNGYFRCGFSWNDTTNLGGGVASHKIQSVLFDHSTFNGIWIQNGGFEANSLTLDGCTFNAYENKVSANDSNPLWFCNTGSCDITVMNCNFTASRPIKLAEQSAYGTKLTIVNNTFDMSVANTANKDNEPKNDAIMLCKIGNGTLGNVVISGNTVEKGTALMAFYNPVGFIMAEGANFTVSGNTLNNAALSVVWKSTDSFVPGFITGSDVTQ